MDDNFSFQLLKEFVSFLILLCCHSLMAQHIASIQLSEKDGLPDIEFYNIIQDSKRFIWLAADNGLYRYDGKSYEHFKHPLEKGNAVFGVLEDDQGRIWCNNISGQFFFVENGKMELFVDLSKSLNGELREFIVTPQHLLVFSSNNVLEIDLFTKSLRSRFDLDENLGSVRINKNGFTYTAGNYIKNTDIFFKTKDSLEIDIFENYVLKSGISLRVCTASNGKINFCYFRKFNKNVFYEYSVEANYYQKIEIPKKLESRKISYVLSLDDEFWFLTDLGVFICEYSDGLLSLKQRLLKSDYTTKIIIDHEENFWLTTKGNGVKILPNIQISQFELPLNLRDVTAIEKINDSIVAAGTKRGVAYLLNINNGRFEVVDSSSAYRISEVLNNPITGNVLFSREEKSFQFNLKSRLRHNLPNTNFDGAKSISLSAEGNYALSTYRRGEVYNSNFRLKNTLLKKRSYVNLVSQKTGHIYFSSVDGLYVFVGNAQVSTILYKDQALYVNSIAEADSGSIWVGTFKNGLYAIDNNLATQHFSVKDGLLSDKITGLQIDANYLWFATEKGVQVLDIIKGSFRNLTKRNGVPSYRISGMVNMDDTMVFATNNGMFQINKEKAFKENIVPEVYFTEIIVGSESKPLKNKYDLTYSENSLQIGFNSNGFESFLNNRYVYRMIGENDNWTKTESPTSFVNYSHLKGGNYTFEVKPLVNDTPIDAQMKSIQFAVTSPLWEQWWFYISIVLTLVSALYFIFRWQIKKLKLKQTLELEREKVNQKLVWSQLENLRSQMNPHFIFNALNSIQEYIVMNEKDLASSFLIKFSRLIRIYLDHSREDNVLLSEEIKALKIYLELEKNRFEDLLDYDISVSEDIQTKSIKIPSLFVQPYVENALKHGLLHRTNNRQLTIIFKLSASKDALICSIEDNGIGIKASQEINALRYPHHKSFATNANERRVELLNTNRARKITVDTVDLALAKATGTRVVIMIPFLKTTL